MGFSKDLVVHWMQRHLYICIFTNDDDSNNFMYLTFSKKQNYIVIKYMEKSASKESITG